jgi:hypothetical protein
VDAAIGTRKETMSQHEQEMDEVADAIRGALATRLESPELTGLTYIMYLTGTGPEGSDEALNLWVGPVEDQEAKIKSILPNKRSQ